MQAAPFDAAPVELGKTRARYAATMWGDDRFALVIDREWRTRTENRSAVAPGQPGTARALLTRNYQDQYGDPGSPLLEENAAGKPVMRFGRVVNHRAKARKAYVKLAPGSKTLEFFEGI